MSGGHFYYQQHRCHDIATMIDELVASNDDETLDEYGQMRGMDYGPEIIERFVLASRTLRRAAAMAQRIDWLVSGDDGEEAFLRRWKEEVEGE